MRILLIHRYFWPDAPPYASMLRVIGRRLACEGHEVAVLSAQPSYNAATMGERRRGREQVDGLQVRRLPLFPNPRRRPAVRMVNTVLFLVQVFWNVWRRSDDLVMFSTMPPVALGLVVRAALVLSDRCGRYVYHCQDIHPEAAHVGGLLPQGRWYRALRRVDTTTCRQAAAVVVLSDDMRATIIERGVESERVHVVNNFSLVEPSAAAAPPAQLLPRREADDFVVAFAGNLGRFQQLDTLIDAARELCDQPSIQLWLVGDGVMRDALHRRAGDLVGHTVHFIGYQPPPVAFGILEQADVAVVSLRAGMHRVAYPSKTMTSLMAGCRLLAVVDPGSELARTVGEADLGTWAPPGNAVEIAHSIRAERKRRSDANRRRARDYAVEHHAAETVSDRWVRLLKRVSDEVVA